MLGYQYFGGGYFSGIITWMWEVVEQTTASWSRVAKTVSSWTKEWKF